MLTVEDILAALVGRSQWVETARRNDSKKQYRRFHGVMNDLETRFIEMRHLTPVYASRPDLATAAGKQTRQKPKGGSLSTLAARAVSGMSGVEWASVLWIIDSDEQAREILTKSLLKTARRAYGRDRYWPRTIRRRSCECGRSASEDYVPDLVQLALLELRTPGVFDTHRRRAEWFGLGPERWRKIVDQPYGVLQGKTFVWFGGACTHIARKLRDETFDRQPEVVEK